jgi:hypothetical protein
MQVEFTDGVFRVENWALQEQVARTAGFAVRVFSVTIMSTVL